MRESFAKVSEILQPPPDRSPWGVGGGGIDGVGRRLKRLAPLSPREERLGAKHGDIEADGFIPQKLLPDAGPLQEVDSRPPTGALAGSGAAAQKASERLPETLKSTA